MKTVIELLNANTQVSDYKINIHNKESYELFFVKGKLETVRCTDTCDKEVTVYANHGDFKGDSQFIVYPSTTTEQITALIEESVAKALMINNQNYELPGAEVGEYTVSSNFADYEPAQLAAIISKAVFDANTVENAAQNSVEVFINKHTETVMNSRGLNKTQVRYDAMVESIPTYNGETQSVELYEQYNFSSLDLEALTAEIAGKMAEVKARYEAAAPEAKLDCPVVLKALELAQFFGRMARDLNYSTVYSHSNLFKKGDAFQKDLSGDPIGITMKGEVAGNIRSNKFDSDGLSLGEIRIIDGGKAVNYYGSNRFGQYLGETPTGNLQCMCVDTGSAVLPETYLEVLSMSGLQVDFHNDYMGGEIRLAYVHEGDKITPVTGISISGKVSEVLNTIRLSDKTVTHNSYVGPDMAVLTGMNIF